MIPAILAALGAQLAGQTVVPWASNKINEWMNGPQQADPNVAAQQNYLQQIQQPINNGFGQRQQQLMNQFNQQIIPGLQEQFAGAGGLRSSAFGNQLGAAGNNLATNLGALGEENAFQNSQLNQNRLGQLNNYLGQQQGFGLQGQQLAQQGNIANQENMLRRMGLMQQYDLGNQQQANNRMDINARLQAALANQAGQRRFDTAHYGEQLPGFAQAAPGAINAVLKAMGMM